MAYLRLGHIKEDVSSGNKAKGLKNCIDYILNPMKTHNQEYTGGHNLILTSSDKGQEAYDETVRKMLPYNQEYVLKEGTYPEKAQEIAAGRAFFDAVGYHDVKGRRHRNNGTAREAVRQPKRRFFTKYNLTKKSSRICRQKCLHIFFYVLKCF